MKGLTLDRIRFRIKVILIDLVFSLGISLLYLISTMVSPLLVNKDQYLGGSGNDRGLFEIVIIMLQLILNIVLLTSYDIFSRNGTKNTKTIILIIANASLPVIEAYNWSTDPIWLKTNGFLLSISILIISTIFYHRKGLYIEKLKR